MRKRSTEILQRLLRKHTVRLRISRLLQEYNITDKTLWSDVNEIKEFIHSTGLPGGIYSDRDYLWLSEQLPREELEHAIYAMDMYVYKASLEERKIYIILSLVYHEGYYSMQKLADELYVTRNTIINDCRVIDNYLAGLQIDFVAKSKKGILIQADEEQVQQLLIDIFRRLLHKGNQQQDYFAYFIEKKIGFCYSIKDVLRYMNEYVQQHKMLFVGEMMFEMSVCIFVLLNRLSQIQGDLPSEEHQQVRPFDLLGNMIAFIGEKLQCSWLGYDNVLTIEKHIFQQNIHPQVQSITDFDLYGIVCRFLVEVDSELKENIHSDNLLIESLISHIKELNNWGNKDYDWHIDEEEAGEFRLVKSIAENKFSLLEKYLRGSMTEKMKDSIVIHICAALLRRHKDCRSMRVIVTCPGSMATSKYVEAQLKRYFDFQIVGNMTTAKLAAQPGPLHADYIISTVPIPKAPLPVLVVSPLLTIEDIHKLQATAFQMKPVDALLQNQDFPMLRRLQQIYSVGHKDRIGFWERELSKLLVQEQFMLESADISFMLLKMLKPKYIQICDGQLDWRSAMQQAAGDLVRDGYFDDAYVQEAIGNVEKYGSYIIVNEGIALAHARKESGVYEDGIALLVSKDGIVFDEGMVVHLLFFFGQKGDTDYINLFKEIIALGKKQEDIRYLCDQEDASGVYNNIYRILRKSMS